MSKQANVNENNNINDIIITEEKDKILETKEQELNKKEQNLIEQENKLNALSEKLSKKYEEIESKIENLKSSTEEIQENIQNFPSTKEYSKEALISESKSVGEILSEGEKIRITIPKSEINPLEKNVPVTINGYTYNILRGENVEVPIEVYNILKESKYI
ncbi:MAG: hypothetical protein HFE81_03500 [Bacilli bacterium]|nr:hypothetical protein [Bacilli bacterium]